MLGAGLLVFLTGCEDPSNVGLGLVEGEGAQPQRLTLSAEKVQETDHQSITGNQNTLLVGQVDDPLFGTVETVSSLDLQAPATLPETFENEDNDISSVTLKLRRSYLYGDTTGTITLNLHSIPNSWEADRARSDTSISAGNLITSVTVAPEDTLVQISLPEAWIEDNNDLLRSGFSEFNPSFHGFQLQAPEASLVEGFNADDSTSVMEVVVDDEAATFQISQELVTVKRTEPVNSPSGNVVVQDGAGPAVTLDFPFDNDSLKQSVLNRAQFFLPVNTETMDEQNPAGFVRPLPQALMLYGVTAEGQRRFLGAGGFSTEKSRYTFAGQELTRRMQDVLIGNVNFDHYLVTGPSPSAVTVSGALLFDQTHETRVPRATLTFIPAEN